MEATTSPMAAVDQELVAYLFAATDGPLAREAHRAIDVAKHNMAALVGANQPIALSGPPTAGLLEAWQSPDRAFQVLLRQESDLLVLSLLLTGSRPGSASTWIGLDELLDRVLKDGGDALLGSVRLYLAKHAVLADAATHVLSRDVGRVVASDLPSHVQQSGWWERPPTQAGALQAWDLAPHVQGREGRGVVILAPTDGDRELSRWAWSDGSPRLAPFARYLKHAAKIDYELRVYSEAAPASDLCRLIETRIQQQAVARAGTRPAVVDAGDDELLGLRDRAAVRIALVKAMERTVQIAASNARGALHTEPSAHSGMVEDDADLWTWFQQRMSDDVAYLESAHEAAVRLGGSAASARPAPPIHDDEPVVGLVTALPEEFVAMAAMITGGVRENVADDRANYLVGTMPSADPDTPHRVVLTLLGDTGNDAAAAACADLARSYRSVGVVLMVGIAAGVPDVTRPDRHVRLGDIVASTWGIVDYDHVVDTAGGRVGRQPFPRPSRLLAQQANWLVAQEMLGNRPWEARMDGAVAGDLAEFARPPQDTDVLYRSDGAPDTLAHPDPAVSGHRPGRPKVHHGHIGSADRALRNAAARDELARAHNLRALEMEGKGVGDAGFAAGLEWLVVRGVSDYGDSRTDSRWRKYASLAAASYTWALLGSCPPFAPRGVHTRSVRGGGRGPDS